jgi:hypothetical protein
MATLYATLAQLKKRLGIDPEETSDDDDIQDALDAAAENVESDTGGRQFYLDDIATPRIFNPHGLIEHTPEGVKLLIDDIGSLDGLIVEVGNPYTNEWTAVTNYLVGPENALVKNRPIEWLIRRHQPWTFTPSQRVRITARWGWPVIPRKITQATLLRGQRLYRRKTTPEGYAGSATEGVVRLSRYDSDYDKLIGSFNSPGFGA